MHSKVPEDSADSCYSSTPTSEPLEDVSLDRCKCSNLPDLKIRGRFRGIGARHTIRAKSHCRGYSSATSRTTRHLSLGVLQVLVLPRDNTAARFESKPISTT